MARDHLGLVDVDVGAFLVSSKYDLVIHAEVLFVLNDHLDVAGSLHVAAAAIRLQSHVSNLLVVRFLVVSLTLAKIILVRVIGQIVTFDVRVFMRYLEYHFVFQLYILVIRKYEHKLAVIGHVIVLINLLLILHITVKQHFVLLHKEVRVLMLHKRLEVLVLPLI